MPTTTSVGEGVLVAASGRGVAPPETTATLPVVRTVPDSPESGGHKSSAHYSLGLIRTSSRFGVRPLTPPLLLSG